MGLDASKLTELKGTFTVSGNAATARVDMISGTLGYVNPINMINSLSSTAKAAGAQTLRIEGTIANEKLLDLLTKRFNFVSSGSTEYIEILLK